jgi:beta-lysine 5,6-aminomutase beta subunit
VSDRIRPYGDSTNDGLVQVSFTLPLPNDDRAVAAAHDLAKKMGLGRAQVAHRKAMGPNFTFFIVYGAVEHWIEPNELIVEERGFPSFSYQDVNRMIRENLKRQLVVVGACTGTDAHTVGLDAILSMKGYAGDHGLEYFPEMRVINMGAQVEPSEIVAVVEKERADAVLVSQVVTQRDAHLLHLREVRDALVAAGRRDDLLLVGGGPRFTPEQAGELGYDRIFGRGTRPSDVAAYLAFAIANNAGSLGGTPEQKGASRSR